MRQQLCNQIYIKKRCGNLTGKQIHENKSVVVNVATYVYWERGMKNVRFAMSNRWSEKSHWWGGVQVLSWVRILWVPTKARRHIRSRGVWLQAFVAHWNWVLGCNFYLGTSTIVGYLFLTYKCWYSRRCIHLLLLAVLPFIIVFLLYLLICESLATCVSVSGKAWFPDKMMFSNIRDSVFAEELVFAFA